MRKRKDEERKEIDAISNKAYNSGGGGDKSQIKTTHGQLSTINSVNEESIVSSTKKKPSYGR